MTYRPHPTPTRLRYLADAEAGTLPMRLTVAMYELVVARWIEPAEDGKSWWRPTAYGRAIAAVRIHTREDGKHIVAETGDPDEPRHLGDAKPIKPGRQWLITVGRHAAARDRVHEAREELRHMAATALAADPASTVQEGQD